MFKYDAYLIDEHRETLDRLADKKRELDQARPLSPIILDRLIDDLSLEWTHHSTSIEGNTLSLNETALVINEGMTVGGKSLREHFEVHNHDRAITHLHELVDSDYTLRSGDILDVHRLVLTSIEDEYAGRIRTGGVRIMGANFTPPNARKVPDLLDELIDYINDNVYDYDDILLSTFFHHQLVWIHPFFDGNGRTARLTMNLLLMRSGYPPAIILRQDRKKYFSALNQANKGNYDKLLLMMCQAVERSLNIYLNALPDAPEYRPITDIVAEPGVPYGQEYVSLLARQGKIDAYKDGRNWLTTSEAVAEYVSRKKKKS